MSNDMIAIKGNKLPAHLQKKAKGYNPFAAAVSAGGFPVVSIKGKVFHVQRGDERTLVTKPGEDDEPAASLEVVIIDQNPHKSKVYYAHGYEEGSNTKPDCYSNDGVAPAADAEDRQAAKCATCPHNQWGSRITENGAKGKACADSMRLAVSPAGQLNDPMLLRVPAASLKTLGSYGGQLAKRGVDPVHVVTKIGFDYSVAYPALTFKAVRFIEEDEMNEVEEVRTDEAETLSLITGVTGEPTTEAEAKAEAPVGDGDDDDQAEAEAAAAAAKAKKAKAAKAAAAAAAAEEEDDDDEAAAAAAAAKAKKAKAAKAAKAAAAAAAAEEEDEVETKKSAKAKVEEEAEEGATNAEDYNSIDDALDNLDFDD